VGAWALSDSIRMTKIGSGLQHNRRLLDGPVSAAAKDQRVRRSDDRQSDKALSVSLVS